MRIALVTLVAFSTLAGCASGAPGPATLDTKNDACAHCRMSVIDVRCAAQLVAPQEEPKFFDDIGCLRDYVKGRQGLPAGSIAYVADHRSGAWIPAARALYTRNEAVETPMGSHVIAHADDAARNADPATRGGTPLTARDVFGPAGPPDGAR